MLWKLFKETFLLSAFTLGGGYVIVSLMQKKFVEQYGWIDEEEMLDLVAIAQSAPGAVVINTSVAVGFRLYGVLGALVTVLAAVLPPMLILMGTFFVYDSVKENTVVKVLLEGMQIGTTALVIDVVLTMVAGLYQQRNVINWGIYALSLIMALVYHINVLVIVLSMSVLGTSLKLLEKRLKRAS